MKHDKINTLSLTDFKIDFYFMIKYLFEIVCILFMNGIHNISY